MQWLTNTAIEAERAGTHWILLFVLVNTILTRHSKVRRIVVGPLALFGLHLLLLPVLGALKLRGEDPIGYTGVRLACLMLGALASVMALGSLTFTQLTPRLRIEVPRILQDVIIGAASAIALLAMASRAGIHLTGLIATSAVLTAVIGLSLQETLGNIVSGLALQMDDSIHLGDWVVVGGVEGKVTQIRWRYTKVETRDWETVIFPNSMLIKGQVTVLGRREGEPKQWRRWVRFNVDFRFPPPKVVEVVTEALHAAPIPRVAETPRPDCLVMEFAESYTRYAVRYWLTDIAVDDPTDSEVRMRVFYALRRAGLPLSIPAHALFVTEETQQRQGDKAQEERDRRTRVLGRIDLFERLTEDERAELAQSLRYAPFSVGEALTQQGAEAHWLYIIETGRVAVRIRDDSGLEKEVAQLGAGEFFGERSLLTGDRRSATIVALTPVECWRLDKSAFEQLLERRPELADEVAELLARRHTELARVAENLSAEAAAKRLAESRVDLLVKVRRFFSLESR